MDELNDVNDPATMAAADQMKAESVEALRKSRAFMLVTVDADGQPRVRCTSTDTLTLGETARWAHGIGHAANKCISRLEQGIALSIERHKQDEDAA